MSWFKTKKAKKGLGVEFGDEVRIASTPVTVDRGYAGKSGTCLGVTTPSVTGVLVIGEIEGDRALNVRFNEPGVEDAWFSTRLVEFVSHAHGTTAKIGRKTFRRESDGTWARQ